MTKQWYMTRVKHGLILSDYQIGIHRKTGAYTKRVNGFCKNVSLFVPEEIHMFFASNVSLNMTAKVEPLSEWLDKLSQVYDTDITKEVRDNQSLTENLKTVKQLFGHNLVSKQSNAARRKPADLGSTPSMSTSGSM